MTRLSPRMQTQAMLSWFERAGVRSLDIHLRVPMRPGVRYDDPHWIWITEHEDTPIKSVERDLAAWIRHKNACGADIYLRPHGRVAQPVIFLDDIETHKALRISQKYNACIIETSPGNTHVWLATATPLIPAKRKAVQDHLCKLTSADPRSTSGNHLGRLCGVKSQKHGCWVNYLFGSDGARYCPTLLDNSPSLPHGDLWASKKKSPSLDLSTSAREFGWVLGRLRIGTPRQVVQADLAKQAEERGVRASDRYAARTVENAIRLLDMR